MDITTVQIYAAATKEEHDKALEWIENHSDEIKEVRDVEVMHPTMSDVYPILFVCKQELFLELCAYTKQPYVFVGNR